MNIFSKISSILPVSNSSHEGLEKKHQSCLQELESARQTEKRLLDEMSTKDEETLVLEGAFADLKADFRKENDLLQAQVDQKEQELIAMEAWVTKSVGMISSLRAAFRTMGRILGE